MRTLLTGIALVVLCASCKGPNGEGPPEGSWAGEGTIHRGVGPECPDTWHIATPDGRMLWPVDDAAFQVEGMKVKFIARPREGVSSICMAGTMVELTHIEKR